MHARSCVCVCVCVCVAHFAVTTCLKFSKVSWLLDLFCKMTIAPTFVKFGITTSRWTPTPKILKRQLANIFAVYKCERADFSGIQHCDKPFDSLSDTLHFSRVCISELATIFAAVLSSLRNAAFSVAAFSARAEKCSSLQYLLCEIVPELISFYLEKSSIATSLWTPTLLRNGALCTRSWVGWRTL